jgi:hypothetical protein
LESACVDNIAAPAIVNGGPEREGQVVITREDHLF